MSFMFNGWNFQNIQSDINVNNKGCDVSGFHLTQTEFLILCENVVPVTNKVPFINGL